MWTITEVVDGEERSERFPTASKALESALRNESPSGLQIFNPDGQPHTLDDLHQHVLDGRSLG